MSTIHYLANSDQQSPHKVIEVLDIERGSGSVIATFTVRIGGIRIRNACLRQGRNGSVYLNFPSRRDEHGRWVHLDEIISPKLQSFLQDACHKAVSAWLQSERTVAA